jgi:RimJ/RimL family protein N-acetyltransferase
MNTLQVNPTTGEVFFRLPAPHENIIITPPRESDRDALVLLLNDPRIYKFLPIPPFPYYPHHAEEWLRMTKNKSDKVLEHLREGGTVVGGCPVQYIREIQPDGTDLLLGDVSVSRNEWPEVEDQELRTKMVKENLEKPVGDHSIVWTIGGVPKAQSNIYRL